jgi:hypothetical protein
MIGTSIDVIKWLLENDREENNEVVVQTIISLLISLKTSKIYEIKERREKRSLSQNAYAWKLITEIGNAIRKSKEEVYLQMLEDYGQSEIVSIVSSVSPVGFFKYYKEMGTGTINNKEFTHYKIFKGSSEFDTKEMTIFIDGIIQECKQLGIETMTPEQISLLRLV